MADMKPVTSWKGLNNVGESTRVGMEWLSVADNVDVTNTGRITSREGFTKRANASMRDGFSTKNSDRAYVVADDMVCRVLPGGSLLPLVGLISKAKVSWAEFNRDVYLCNGADFIRLSEDNQVGSWFLPAPIPPHLSVVPGRLEPGLYQVALTFIDESGRESGSGMQVINILANQAISITGIEQLPGAVTRVYVAPANSSAFGLAATTTESAVIWNHAPDMLGEALATLHLREPNEGTSVIEVFQGRMFTAMYFPADDYSLVMFSKPMQPHLFDFAEDYFTVPGEVRMLADAGSALLVGTSVSIHAFDGESLTQLARYGVATGNPCVKDTVTGKVFMWTLRGMCEALPFANLTEHNVSVPPGTRASLAIVERDGQRKLVATLADGGTAFNQRL